MDFQEDKQKLNYIQCFDCFIIAGYPYHGYDKNAFDHMFQLIECADIMQMDSN